MTLPVSPCGFADMPVSKPVLPAIKTPAKP